MGMETDRGSGDESKPAIASQPQLPTNDSPSDQAVQRRDPLAQYMAELRHHAPLSRDEEHTLAIRWIEQGDREAARLLVLSNLRLVVKIAMEYRRSWTNLLDLIQEGNLGLLQAVQRFDPHQGTKLSTYAAYWIRAYILKHLIDNIRLVRIGNSRADRKLFFRLNKEKRELENQGFEAEPKLLAERLDVSPEDVIGMEQRLSEGEVSLEAPVQQGFEGSVFGDSVSTGEPGAEERVADAELRQTFIKHIQTFAKELDEREQLIVDRRILAEEPCTLQEIGEAFGISRERVRQLEARIIERMREYLRENIVDFDYYGPDD